MAGSASESAPSGSAPSSVARAICCPGHGRPVHCVKWAEKNGVAVVLSGCLDKMPMLRWGDNGDWIGTFAGHKGAVWGVSCDGGLNRVATAGADFCAKLWNAESGELIHTFDHKHIVKTVDFDASGKRLLTGGMEKLLRVFDLTNLEAAAPIFELSLGSVISKAIWLNEKLIACALNDGTIAVVDVRAAEKGPVAVLGVPGKSTVKDMELSGKVLTVAIGKKVIFYDTATYKPVKTFSFEFDVVAASLHPDGTQFAAGGSDLWVHVFDRNTGKEVACHKGHHGPVFCLRYARDGTIASGSEDATVRLWR